MFTFSTTKTQTPYLLKSESIDRKVHDRPTLQQCMEMASLIEERCALSAAQAQNLRERVKAHLSAPQFEEQTFTESFNLSLTTVREILSHVRHVLDSNDKEIRVVEGLMVFLVRCSGMSTATDVFTALTSLCHALLPGSVTCNLQKLIFDRFADDFFVPQFELQNESSVPTEDDGLAWASTFLEGVRGKFDLMASIRETPLMGKLHKFLLYCLSHSIFANIGLDFDSMGYTKFEAAAIAKAHSSKLGFVYCLLDSLTMFCQQFVSAVRVGSFEPFYHSSATYDAWFVSIAKLKEQEKLLGDPEPHGFSVFSYRADLSSAIERGEAIQMATRGASKFLKERIATIMADLRMLAHNDISRKSAQRDRAAPFGVLFAGGSSIGKSTLINIIFQYYAARFGLSNDTSSKYTRNPGEKYWNNFSTAQWCIVMDDIAAISPSLGTEDPSLREIIGVMNNVAFQPDQASLDDKGRTPVQARLVIATTNTIHLNAHAYFSCPIAIQRRLPFVVDVRVKECYATNRMLDPSKLFRANGSYPDYWVLRVLRVVPETDDPQCKKGKTVLVREFDCMTNFLRWFGATAAEHEERQKHIGKELFDTASIAVCSRCDAPSYHCGCDYEPVPPAANYPQPNAAERWERDQTTVHANQDEEYREMADLGYAINNGAFNGHFAHLSDDESSDGSEEPLSDTDTSSSFEEQAFVYALRQGAGDRLTWSEYLYSFWTTDDTRSLLYTIGVQIMITLWAGIHSFLGLSFFALTASFMFESMSGLTLDNLLFRFMLRRVGYKAQQQFKPLIMWGKVFAIVSLGTYGGLRIATYIRTKGAGKVTCSGCKQSVDALHATFEAETPLAEQTDVITGRAPISGEVERVNVWYKEDFNLTRFDVGTLTSSWNALDKEYVKSRIRNSCYRVDISGPGFPARRTGMVAMGGHLYAINSHSLPEANFMHFAITRCSGEGVNSNHNSTIVASQIWRSERSDIAYISFRGLPVSKDLTCLLPNASFNGRFEGCYVGLEADHSNFNRSLYRVSPESCAISGRPLAYFGGDATEPTRVGDCGAALIVWSGHGPVLAGLHALGSVDGQVKAARFYPEDVDAARKALGSTTFQCGEPLLNAPSAPLRAIAALSPKSPFRYLETGQARVYGSLTGPRHAPRSRVERTIMAPLLERHGFTQKFGAPQMSGWKPWRIAAQPMLKKDSLFREDILKHASQSFLTDILRDLPEGSLETVHVYDTFTAINGACGVAYVDGMKKATSAGFPWCTSKRKFLVELEAQEGFDTPVTATPEVLERVEAVFKCYAEGRRFHPVFKGNLKDEATKWKKVESGKTRVFGGAPFDWSIAGRKMFLPLIRLIQNNRYVFESAPGTVAQSYEWGEMHAYLTTHGDRIIAGDFGDFDKGMLAMFILEAFAILRGIAEAAGYSPQELHAMEGFAIDTAYPLFDFNGDLVEFAGTNPSGHILTVIINGLVNCLYMRYCYTVLNPEKHCTDFKERVKLMTYGDDNVMGVRADTPWFNHTALQNLLALHGITYTMPDKTSESVAYVSIADVSFLKRSWRFDGDVGFFLCPLEEESIEKSLITWVASKSVAPGEQAIDVMSSACSEYFFYGKERFTKMRALMFDIINELGLSHYAQASKFPTWETLAARYQLPETDEE